MSSYTSSTNANIVRSLQDTRASFVNISNSVAQNVTVTTPVQVVFGTTNFAPTDANMTVVGNSVVIGAAGAGQYRMVTSCSILSGAAGIYILDIYVNGVLASRDQKTCAAATVNSFQVMHVQNLLAGNIVTVFLTAPAVTATTIYSGAVSPNVPAFLRVQRAN